MARWSVLIRKMEESPWHESRRGTDLDFVKEVHKCGLEPVVEIDTLPDGTVRTKMRATDRLSSTIPQQSDQEPNEWDDDH